MPNTSTEKQNLLQILYWSSTVKIIFGLALTAILVVLSLTGTLMFNAWPVISILLPLLIIVNAALLLLAKKGIGWAGQLIYPEIFLNILIVTFISRISGEEHANFLFLYIMPAFTASLVSLRVLNFTFALSVVCYGIEHYLTMTPGSGLSTFAAAVLNGEELSDFFLLILIIGAIGFQARYYIGRIKEANEKLMDLKDEFMYRTVHDLRGPASTIKFVIEKYEDSDISKSDPKKIREDLATIDGLNAHLLVMVEELLQIAKGEQADIQVNLESLNLTELISTILGELQKEISRKDIRIDYAPAEIPLVRADRLRLREVVGNLIENGVKYNRTGGQLKVGHETKGKFLITTFENTSVDVLTEEDLEKFFKPYAQIGRDDEPGTGLGLYIVKKLVEKMGGEVSVAFDSGKDRIAFHVSLPIAAN